MPEALSGLTSVLSSPAIGNIGKLLGVGSTGFNLFEQYKNQQYQDKLRSFAMDPAKMNAYAAKFTQPLNAGLTTGVANQAQAFLASRGLSDSPQISEQVEAQAIAPYIQQNQQAGYQDALQALGIGGGAINPGQQQDILQGGLARLLAMNNGGNPYQVLLNAQNPDRGGIEPSSPPVDVPIPEVPLQDFYSNAVGV